MRCAATSTFAATRLRQLTPLDSHRSSQISAKYGTSRYTFVTAALAAGGAQGGAHRLDTGAMMFSSIALGPNGAFAAPLL